MAKKSKKKDKAATQASDEVTSAAAVRDALRLPLDPEHAREYLLKADPAATLLAPGDKVVTTEALIEQGTALADLQERLYAAAKGGSTQRVLLVLQGMDTSGKGGVIRHVIGLVDPQGVHLHSFKAPTETERKHHFLWRVKAALPGAGMIGIFDRSHYEDVLIVRVHDMVASAEWQKRYAEINAFEQELAADGVVIIKCFLNVSAEEQKARLIARLDDPTKHWKYNPGDVDERQHWNAYQAAYLDALTKCNSEVAPWYVVPADRKWYRNWAIGQILFETLSQINPQYPVTDINVEAEKARLAAGI